ncbi:MAG: pirin family protein, partial [Methylococcales bacterium]|nr:pirin family protein [Methylococcales bacterium]
MKEMREQTFIRRPADERGEMDHGWLHARFSFSFANYFDPDQMGFHAIRVMNNDTIQPGDGFPTHPHEEMEIFTYVIEGRLEHRDSLGNGAVIEAGSFQYMSAGSGIQHSEFNPSETDVTHLYQIWLRPNELGVPPRYAEKIPADFSEPNNLTLLFSGSGRDDSVRIRQDAEILFASVEAGQSLVVPTSDEFPHVWIQVIEGSVVISSEELSTGDGLGIENAE